MLSRSHGQCGLKLNFCLAISGLLVAGTSSAIAQGQQYVQPQSQNTGQTENFNVVPLTTEQQAALQSAQQGNYDQQNLAAAEAAAIQQPTQPFADLTEAENQYLQQFLDHWQATSEQVEQYVCEFRRFAYDSEIVNYRDPATNRLAAASIAVGEIRYSEPDKGFYQTNQIWSFKAPPTEAGGEAEYDELTSEESKEKWICDGRNIYEFDFAARKLYEMEIPADLQGEKIIDSPLPFLFGAKKSQILERYWVRIVPQNSADEFWLEAFPKRIEDARMYSRIEVILAKEDFLPKAMHMYSPQYDPQKGNFQSSYFAFENRKINGQLQRFKDFFGFFVRPQTPITGGWKRVNRSALHEDQQAALPSERK